MPAICLSNAQVTSIHRDGFWLQYGGEELYLPFIEFPWFEHATIAQLSRVECPGGARLYWPALDVDLTVESIRNPMAVSLHGASFDY
jgi:hypothetical protein